MSTNELLDAILMDHLGVERSKLVPTANIMDDLGADSLDKVDVMMNIETSYDITIPDAEAEKLTTVGDVVAYLDKVVAAKSA